jgi:Raf kinase inhibitor-like YbhB/YbcL family protein
MPDVPSMILTSTDISAGDRLGQHFVHTRAGGDDLSPQLAWSGFPAETQGFAVTCFDPDAPTGNGFWHWVVVNLPPDVTELPAGAGAASALPKGASHVRNDFGNKQYDGAAPPRGDAHRYVFTVHALDVDHLDVPDSASAAQVGYDLPNHALARGVLQTTYQAA